MIDNKSRLNLWDLTTTSNVAFIWDGREYHTTDSGDLDGFVSVVDTTTGIPDGIMGDYSPSKYKVLPAPIPTNELSDMLIDAE